MAGTAFCRPVRGERKEEKHITASAKNAEVIKSK
nr:MAG TPA: hypothetical protein [Caudoviricetes sp.]